MSKLVIKDRARLSIGNSFSVSCISEYETDGGTYFSEVKGNSYNYGMLPPRYPVPAITLTVDVWWDTVGIFAWNGDKDEVVASFIKR